MGLVNSIISTTMGSNISKNTYTVARSMNSEGLCQLDSEFTFGLLSTKIKYLKLEGSDLGRV